MHISPEVVETGVSSMSILEENVELLVNKLAILRVNVCCYGRQLCNYNKNLT